MNLNLIIAAAIVAALAVGYAALASHHHARGYAAHKAEIAAEIAAVNAERDEIAITLATERAAHADRITDAQLEAMRGAQSYCRENPSACGIEASGKIPAQNAKPACASVCGTPARVRAKLDAIQ